MSRAPADVTRILVDWSQGNQDALDKLIPLVYEELRQLADRRLNRRRLDQTLQTTALVHEVYLRLVDQSQVHWQDRAHFFAIAANLMRYILVDYARRKRTAKRGGQQPKLSLDEVPELSDARDLSLVSLDDALTSLTAIDPLKGRIVELRVFGGLTVEETAEVLHLSTAKVKREWSTAKAWLHRELTKTKSNE